MADDKEFPGLEMPNTQADPFNAMQFLIDQTVGRMSKIMLVKVVKVTTAGEVGPTGFVDVQPLVKMTDSQGKVQSHGVVHGMPFYRAHGGAGKGIILDPKVGQIGLALVADRDVSVVKTTKKESQPGSFRQHDLADGLFLGGFLSDAPTCYIRFTDDDKIIVSPDNGTTVITIEANKISIQIGSLGIFIHDGKIFLGEDNAVNAVETTAGPSSVVFAKI